MSVSPDLVIFRIPDDPKEVGPTFVCFRITPDGLENVGRIFTLPVDDDHYSTMSFTEVVLAQEIDGGSVDLAWYTIFDPDDREQVVHELLPDQADMLQEIILGLVLMYESDEAGQPTLH